MNSETRFLLYGSYGYTGDLVARLAVQQGFRPILAGRNGGKLVSQAVALGLEHFVFDLGDRPALDRALGGVDAVLNCAGPFSRTAAPMVDGCLRTGTHYLDITGEIAVFEALAARDDEARKAGIALMPGVGFDVVPSDCLAAHLKERLPTATHLALAVAISGTYSQGTAITTVESANQLSTVREDGTLVAIPPGSRTRRIDFGRGPVDCVAVSLGDVVTAYHTTGIPNIEVYTALPAWMRWSLTLGRYGGRLMASSVAQRAMKAAIRRLPRGPSAEQRAQGQTRLWGEARDDEGHKRVSRLRTPETYTVTAQAALAATQKVLAGRARPGFVTPAQAFGPDFILRFPGVERQDLV